MKTIGLTLGDAAGIGPEVVHAALLSGQLDHRFSYRVIGATPSNVTAGEPTSATARAAVAALEEAAACAARGEIAAIVTGPIHKHRLQSVGFAFPGQTEFFAARSGVENFAMLLTGGSLTVALVTAHLPIKEVASVLRQDEIVRVGSLLVTFLIRRFGLVPRVAVAGLNPHAGESGALGCEEQEIIIPAVEQLRQRWADDAEFAGPFSPDTVFHQSVRGASDAVLCMYHDQGLIPLKLHAFDEGVNVTLGLPFIRTSPDHGTAFDIAGKNLARPDSTIAAINLAAELVAKHVVVSNGCRGGSL